jgi:primosomal protein N' (replication factor Y)
MRDTRLIGFARENRQSATDAERLLWYHLRHQSQGVKFRRQHPIGPYVADFACLSRKLVIEIDGSQHRDSPYDRVRDMFMRDQGWIVLRFWAWEVVRNIGGVLNGIADAIEEDGPS